MVGCKRFDSNMVVREMVAGGKQQSRGRFMISWEAKLEFEAEVGIVSSYHIEVRSAYILTLLVRGGDHCVIFNYRTLIYCCIIVAAVADQTQCFRRASLLNPYH